MVVFYYCRDLTARYYVSVCLFERAHAAHAPAPTKEANYAFRMPADHGGISCSENVSETFHDKSMRIPVFDPLIWGELFFVC